MDTSVWIDHLRSGNSSLVELLESDQVVTHPFIVGELACGNLKNRRQILRLLQSLPLAVKAGDYEVFALIENRELYGIGVGWIDIHLLASALLTQCALWTLDTQLRDAAEAVGLHS